MSSFTANVGFYNHNHNRTKSLARKKIGIYFFFPIQLHLILIYSPPFAFKYISLFLSKGSVGTVKSPPPRYKSKIPHAQSPKLAAVHPLHCINKVLLEKTRPRALHPAEKTPAMSVCTLPLSLYTSTIYLLSLLPPVMASVTGVATPPGAGVLLLVAGAERLCAI